MNYYKNYIQQNSNYEFAGIYADEGISGTNTKKRDEFMMAWNALNENRDEIKVRWETLAEFGNPLEQYRAIQFADITENAKHITDFEIDFML